MIAEGSVLRERMENSQLHYVDLYTTHSKASFGALHLLKEETCFASAVCESDTCKTYILTGDVLRKHLYSNDLLARE
eukprot:Pgem_evm1s2854